MCLEDTVRIPLRAKDGSIVAYTLVDAADAVWINERRWHLSSTGYAVRIQKRDGRSWMIRLHREILGLTCGDSLHGDHINRDKLDNRRSNLRAVPSSGNRQNSTPQIGKTSAYRGVTWHKTFRKWQASVKVGRRFIYLGRFASEEQAAEAARAGRAKHLPFATD